MTFTTANWLAGTIAAALVLLAYTLLAWDERRRDGR